MGVDSLQQRQEWSFDDSGKFEGAASNGNINGYCISSNPYNNPVVGGFLYEQGCTGGFDTETWNPDTQVGAGAAGNNTQQLVNYLEFGRCLDATDQDPNHAWMIDYPCKQAPDPAKITWNQRYTYNSTAKTISTYDTANGTTYCLTAPATMSGTVDQQRRHAQDLRRHLRHPADLDRKWRQRELRHVVHDRQRRSDTACRWCSPVSVTVITSSSVAIIAGTCDGSLVQKWNAPANFIDSRFKGTAEDQGGH